jgi:hypothetical protein
MPWNGYWLSDAVERRIYQGRRVPYKPVAGCRDRRRAGAGGVGIPNPLMAEDAHACDEFESKTWSAPAKGRAYPWGCDKGKDANHEPRH